MQNIDVLRTDHLYRFGEDGVTIEAEIGKDVPPASILRVANDGYGATEPYIHRFNRAVKRERTFLCAGNDPVFAMTTFEVLPQNDPPLLALGEWHGAVYRGGKRYAFEEADRIAVQHLPGGTRWRIRFRALPGLCFVLYASLYGEDGIAAVLQAEGEPGAEPLTAELALLPGTIGTRTFTASYFPEDSQTFLPLLTPPETAAAGDGGAFVQWRLDGGCPQVPETARYGVWGHTALHAVRGEGTVTVTVPVIPGTIAAISGVHAHSGEEADGSRLFRSRAAAEQALAAEEAWWRALLARTGLHTPSAVFDGGYSHAVLNMEYGHFRSGWFEGCHWWNCYWTNNYQLSAAISLGQYARAREALVFFGSRENGYDPINTDGGTVIRQYRSDGSPKMGYDGIPYYLWQLWQYVQQTGDLSVVDEVADHVDVNCRVMLEACDPDGDGLYSWHFGSNMLLYQADHLASPGIGVSPSIIIACVLARFSALLEASGRGEQAAFYREKSRKAYAALEPLWDAGRGCYPAGVDLGGRTSYAHYYTDLVYPALYGEDTLSRKVLSLLHLKDSLCLRSAATGKRLMRVGDLQPDLFGNNNVMPVQMAEAARAFFAVGDRRTGTELLDSLTYAYSLYTESPGSAPERLNDDGKAEANFIFGNPAGALPYAVIDGLCGVALEECGHTLRLEPGFPEEWERADLCLPYAEVHYTHTAGEYRLRVRLPQDSAVDKLRFSVCIPGLIRAQAQLDGAELPCRQTPALESVRAETEASVRTAEFELLLRYVAQPKPPRALQTVRTGETACFAGDGETLLPDQPTVFDQAGIFHQLYTDGNCLRDQPIRVVPAFALSRAQIRGGMLHVCGQAWGAEAVPFDIRVGGRTVFGTAHPDAEGNFVWETPWDEARWPAYLLWYTDGGGRTECLDVPVEGEFGQGQPLALESYINAQAMPAVNRWRWQQLPLPLVPKGERPDRLKVSGVSYRLAADERQEGLPGICVLEKGSSLPEQGQIAPVPYPAEIRIPIHAHANALSLLYAGEVDPRLTGEVLGDILLRYADGERRIPLQSGQNIGSLFSNYARQVTHVPLADERFPHDSVNHCVLGAQPERLLEELVISLRREDARLGLLAVTLF